MAGEAGWGGGAAGRRLQVLAVFGGDAEDGGDARLDAADDVVLPDLKPGGLRAGYKITGLASSGSLSWQNGILKRQQGLCGVGSVARC